MLAKTTVDLVKQQLVLIKNLHNMSQFSFGLTQCKTALSFIQSSSDVSNDTNNSMLTHEIIFYYGLFTLHETSNQIKNSQNLKNEDIVKWVEELKNSIKLLEQDTSSTTDHAWVRNITEIDLLDQNLVCRIINNMPYHFLVPSLIASLKRVNEQLQFAEVIRQSKIYLDNAQQNLKNNIYQAAQENILHALKTLELNEIVPDAQHPIFQHNLRKGLAVDCYHLLAQLKCKQAEKKQTREKIALYVDANNIFIKISALADATTQLEINKTRNSILNLLTRAQSDILDDKIKLLTKKQNLINPALIKEIHEITKQLTQSIESITDLITKKDCLSSITNALEQIGLVCSEHVCSSITVAVREKLHLSQLHEFLQLARDCVGYFADAAKWGETWIALEHTNDQEYRDRIEQLHTHENDTKADLCKIYAILCHVDQANFETYCKEIIKLRGEVVDFLNKAIAAFPINSHSNKKELGKLSEEQLGDLLNNLFMRAQTFRKYAFAQYENLSSQIATTKTALEFYRDYLETLALCNNTVKSDQQENKETAEKHFQELGAFFIEHNSKNKAELQMDEFYSEAKELSEKNEISQLSTLISEVEQFWYSNQHWLRANSTNLISFYTLAYDAFTQHDKLTNALSYCNKILLIEPNNQGALRKRVEILQEIKNTIKPTALARLTLSCRVDQDRSNLTSAGPTAQAIKRGRSPNEGSREALIVPDDEVAPTANHDHQINGKFEAIILQIESTMFDMLKSCPIGLAENWAQLFKNASAFSIKVVLFSTLPPTTLNSHQKLTSFFSHFEKTNPTKIFIENNKPFLQDLSEQLTKLGINLNHCFLVANRQYVEDELSEFSVTFKDSTNWDNKNIKKYFPELLQHIGLSYSGKYPASDVDNGDEDDEYSPSSSSGDSTKTKKAKFKEKQGENSATKKYRGK